MMSAVQLLKFRGAAISSRSHSFLVDFQQIHVRNFFLFSFGLCIARQHFGDFIDCQMDRAAIEKSFLDTKCFMNGTRSSLSDPLYATLPILYHDYYQWVPVVLLLLAFSFHFPFRVWSRNVHHYVEELTTKLDSLETCCHVKRVIASSGGNHLFWKIWLLENVYALHLLVQINLLNHFFYRVPALSGWSWSAISLLFPEMTTCHFDYFGGGSETSGKFRCLMPLSTVYRKVFYVQYCLFCVLIALHIIVFLYRMLLAIRMGPRWVNVWWSLQIAKQAAKTWEVACELNHSYKQWRCEEDLEKKMGNEKMLNKTTLLQFEQETLGL